jgi:glucose/mannose transport system permease protein
MSTETSVANDTGFDFDLGRVGLYVALVGLLVFYLLPLETGLMTSLKTDPYASAPFLPPLEGSTFENYGRAFDALSTGLVNSFILTIPATVLSALVGSMAAYGLTNVDWRGQVGVLALFIAGIFIPYQAVLIPVSNFWASIVPLNIWFGPIAQVTPGVETHHFDIIELVITHVAYGLPICTLLFRTFYKDLSDEMIEAARLDGASVSKVYRRIVLPLSGPMFAVVLIYQFTQIWNDLLFALVVVGTGEQEMLVMVALARLGNTLSEVGIGLQMAGALLTALPTILVYVFFGEQFAEGIST